MSGRGCGNGRFGGVSSDHGEVGARQSGRVAAVDDDGPVAEERTHARQGRGVEVDVAGLEGTGGDVTVLAAQVADLASGGIARLTRRALAADEGIEMGESCGAVTVRRDRECVDVIDCGWTLACQCLPRRVVLARTY